MPLVQGGPPEWIWERTPDPLRCDIMPARPSEGHPTYEIRVSCGLGILRVQFLTAEELRGLQDAIEATLGGTPDEMLEPTPAGQRRTAEL